MSCSVILTFPKNSQSFEILLKTALSDERNNLKDAVGVGGNSILEKFTDVNPNDAKAVTKALLEVVEQCSIKEKEFRYLSLVSLVLYFCRI